MRIAPSLVITSLLAACGGSAPAVDAAVLPDASVGVDAHVEVDAATPIDAASGADAGTAMLSGDVTRSTGPQAGGIGDLYVAVFTEDPVVASDTAIAVGRVVLDDVDMRATGASIAYAIPGVPVRAEPYFVVAFLDDNMTASLESPGPDRGDLVTLMGFSSPSVTIASPSDVTLDLVLSTALPF